MTESRGFAKGGHRSAIGRGNARGRGGRYAFTAWRAAEAATAALSHAPAEFVAQLCLLFASLPGGSFDLFGAMPR